VSGAATGPAPTPGLGLAAGGLAERGWSVLPGTYHDGVSWRGRPGAVGLCPVDGDWASIGTPGAGEIARWWVREPYSVLLVCGRGVDCVELPSMSGVSAGWILAALSAAGVCPPAMFAPMRRLVLFVRTPSGACPFLVSASLRSAGSWVALPPTGQYVGRHGNPGYRWAPGRSPDQLGSESDWSLPELVVVNEVITATVAAVALRPLRTHLGVAAHIVTSSGSARCA
jgi:hypothetical protein